MKADQLGIDGARRVPGRQREHRLRSNSEQLDDALRRASSRLLRRFTNHHLHPEGCSRPSSSLPPHARARPSRYAAGMADSGAPSSLESAVQWARALLASESVGVLSTISVHRPGYPYGSVTPYALSATGRRCCFSHASRPTPPTSSPIPGRACSSATATRWPTRRRAHGCRSSAEWRRFPPPRWPRERTLPRPLAASGELLRPRRFRALAVRDRRGATDRGLRRDPLAEVLGARCEADPSS